jgi:hypothetical protein
MPAARQIMAGQTRTGQIVAGRKATADDLHVQDATGQLNSCHDSLLVRVVGTQVHTLSTTRGV